jgi:hypothetical protein
MQRCATMTEMKLKIYATNLTKTNSMEPIAEMGDPDRRDVQIGLADCIWLTRHMHQFLTFPTVAITFNSQNPSFVIAYTMTFFVSIKIMTYIQYQNTYHCTSYENQILQHYT